MKLRHCRSCKQPLPPSRQPLGVPVGAVYYELAKTGLPWAEMERRFHAQGVGKTAWRYAVSAGLPWPPEVGSESSPVPDKPVKLT